MLFLNLVIRDIFLKVVTCLDCWHGCVLQIMNGTGEKNAAGRGKTDRHSGCSLALSWLHLTCHAVLFCCAIHDNCLSGSVEFRDYSG